MSRSVTVAGYLVLALTGVAVEIAARRSGRIATFGTSLASVLRNAPFRVAVVAGWLWLGWHLFVRVSWR